MLQPHRKLPKRDPTRPSKRRRKQPPIYLSPVRRIEKVALEERVCAIVLEGGPCPTSAQPDQFRGKPLTLVLAELLERYGARGTFAVKGESGEQSGVARCPELTARLLAGGHELAGAGYAPVQAKRLLGRPIQLMKLEPVVSDLRRLRSTLEQGWGYPIRLACPPEGLEELSGGFTCYDACALVACQCLGASFDGAGRTARDCYKAEVEAIWRPMERILLENPDFFRGRIIRLPDGCNSAGRTPVADGLGRQLQLLSDHGYRVIPASELLERSPFRDILPTSEIGRGARHLLSMGWCVAYQDNALRPDNPLLRGELAMMAYGLETVTARIVMVRSGRAPFRDMAHRHPYAAAALLATETGAMTAAGGRFRPEEPVTPEELALFCAARLGRTISPAQSVPITHGGFFSAAARLTDGR